MDCGKEFIFDFSELNIGIEENDTSKEVDIKISEYNKKLGIPTPINICSNCLKPIVSSKDSSRNTKKDEMSNVSEKCKKYISKSKEKFEKEEQEFKKYSVEEEEKKEKRIRRYEKNSGKK